MAAYILGIGIAEPQYFASQSDIFTKTADLMNINIFKRNKLKEIFTNTQIQKRHTVVEESKHKSAIEHILQPSISAKGLSTQARNEIYKKEAPKLSLQAAQSTLKSWGGNLNKITHVVSISCTGMYAPGLELFLQQNLKLCPNVNRLAINYMGCFGAFKGLSLAKAIAQGDGNARILVVCTELCSIHMQSSTELASMIPNALFADGAAGVIVGANPTEGETPLWKITHNISEVIANTTNEMTWSLSDNGFQMTLSRKVPIYIKNHTANFINQLITNYNVNLKDCNWPIHPGGKAIIDGVASALNLDKAQLTDTLAVLSNYGNMSSATFLFVLHHSLNSQKIKPWSIGLGFGPGLSFEGVLLENYHAKN